MESMGLMSSKTKKKVAKNDALSTNLFKQARGGLMSNPGSKKE